MDEKYTSITATISEPVEVQLVLRLPDGTTRPCTNNDLKAFKLLFEDDVIERYYRFERYLGAMMRTAGEATPGDAMDVLLHCVRWFMRDGHMAMEYDEGDEVRFGRAFVILNRAKVPLS